MSHFIIKKWIEPYVLLETFKKHYEMKDFTFDGFSKQSVKADFLKQLQKKGAFGLYMKNVNKFYLFSGSEELNLEELFGFVAEDCELTDDKNLPFDMVDSGRAEASVILY